MDAENRRYLIHITLGGGAPTPAHIQEVTPGIKEILERISGGDCLFAYASSDAGTFGFLVKTRMSARKICGKLESPGEGDGYFKLAKDNGSVLRTGDKVLIVEIGEDFWSLGLGKVSTWLQHR